MAAITPQLLIEHPLAALEALTLLIEGPVLTPVWRSQAYFIGALYGLMVVCGVLGCWYSIKDGRLFTRLASNGKRRVNAGSLFPYQLESSDDANPNISAAVFVQVTQIIYCLAWLFEIFYISASSKRDQAREGTIALQFLVSLPLSFCGWMSIWGYLVAIPSRKALVHFHEPQKTHRVERLLESNAFAHFFAFVIPTLTVAMIVPPSIISGLVQRRLWSHWDVAKPLLQNAVANGWTTSSLEVVGLELLEVVKQTSNLDHVAKFVFGGYLFWAVVFLAFYTPVTLRLLHIINQQIHILRRSIANLIVLHQLSLPSCPPTPVVSRRPSTPPDFDNMNKSKSFSSIVTPYAKQLEEEGLQSQLAKAQLFRMMILCQNVAVFSTVITFLVMSCLGVTHTALQVSPSEKAQAVNLCALSYPYLVPALPCSILFVFMTRRQSRSYSREVLPTPDVPSPAPGYEWISSPTSDTDAREKYPLFPPMPPRFRPDSGRAVFSGTVRYSSSIDTGTESSGSGGGSAEGMIGLRGPPSTWKRV